MVLSELIAIIQAKNRDLPPDVIAAAVRRIFDEIADVLAESGRVELRGFGSLSVRRHEARVIRNPRTGQELDARSTKTVHFKASKNITSLLNKPGGAASSRV